MSLTDIPSKPSTDLDWVLYKQRDGAYSTNMSEYMWAVELKEENIYSVKMWANQNSALIKNLPTIKYRLVVGNFLVKNWHKDERLIQWSSGVDSYWEVFNQDSSGQPYFCEFKDLEYGQEFRYRSDSSWYRRGKHNDGTVGEIWVQAKPYVHIKTEFVPALEAIDRLTPSGSVIKCLSISLIADGGPIHCNKSSRIQVRVL